MPEPATSLFAVSRRDYRVVLHDLSPGQHAFLSGCDGRRTVLDALDALEEEGRAVPDTGSLRDWLCEWAARGLFASIA